MWASCLDPSVSSSLNTSGNIFREKGLIIQPASLKWQYFWILIMGPIFISTVKSLLFLANACIITWYYTWNKLWNKRILQIVHRDLRKRNKTLPILLCRLKIFHFPYSCPLLEHPPKGRDTCIHYFILNLLTTSWQGVLIPIHEMMCITEKALCHTFPWDGGWVFARSPKLSRHFPTLLHSRKHSGMWVGVTLL